MSRIQRAIVYVDWGAAQRINAFNFKNRSRTEEKLIAEAITRIDEKISEYLEKNKEGPAVRVQRRFYNGWHQGKTKTKSRAAFEKVQRDFWTQPVRIGSISFDGEFGWGNQLLCGGNRSEIWDTLGRPQGEITREKKQRMVDMCLAADLLHASRFGDADFHIVVSDDDDIWPAIVTSLTWGGKTKIMRVTRQSENAHLNTGAIVI